MPTWFKDVQLDRRGLKVKQTGHYVPLTGGTLVDAARWGAFRLALALGTPKRGDRPQVQICFTPHRPRAWYFPWAIATALGAKIVDQPAGADLVWYFEDATYTAPTAPGPDTARTLNRHCTDVSKSHIAEIFAAVFGYPLAVDPSTYAGTMVEKSQINGAHDGRLVKGPIPALADRVYQRLADNEIDGGLVEDLRTTIMGGRPILVFRKQRAVEKRFENANAHVRLAPLAAVFSDGEISQITQFVEKLGLEAGGLDILRDRASGKLYIVDANKTDMGPPLALPLKDKMTATRQMARALGHLLVAPAPQPSAVTSSPKGAHSCPPISLSDSAV